MTTVREGADARETAPVPVNLAEPPRLIEPTTAVRASWLAGERADVEQDGLPTDLLDEALADFEGLVARRLGVPTMWSVPATVFWYVAGDQYLGELVIRHVLSPALLASGGHVGYSEATPWRRQGHGTRMLAAGLAECRRIGLDRVLLTCSVDNEGSRRVILANGGVFERETGGEQHFWITVPA